MHANNRHGNAARNGKSPTYKAWESMLRRCTNPSQDSYKSHGARGVSVCSRWHDFSNFLADMGERQDGLTLDRIDNGRGYEPGNCRWATQQEQQRNRSNNRRLTFCGASLTVAEWAEKTGIPSPTIRSRIDRYGWTAERALSTPHRTRQEQMRLARSIHTRVYTRKPATKRKAA